MLNNLSSDELRRQLGENNAAMNTLAEDNQKIVELLAERGLKAIEKTAGEDLVCSADKMVIFNAAGAEVFNTDWPNPLIDPDQYEAHSRMADWLSVFSEDRKYGKPLSAEELKAGGWWCADTGLSAERLLSYNGLAIHAPGWDGKYSFCFIRSGRVYRGLPGELSRVTHGLRQIHRRGNGFYWGAP